MARRWAGLKLARARGTPSGAIAYSCSPSIRSGDRLVARMTISGATAQEAGEVGPRVEDLFEIVEHRRHPQAAQGGRQAVDEGVLRAVPELEGAGQGRQHQRGVGDRHHRHDQHSGGKLRRGHLGDPQGQPRLPDPRRAEQRDQAHRRVAEQGREALHIPVAAHERGERVHRFEGSQTPAR